MDAAQELFASIGFDATKMDHIAKRAGVSRQTVYEYSISKEEIYRSVLGRSAQRYVEALDRIDQRQEPRAVLADVLAAMIDEYLGSSRLLLMDVALHQQIVPPANTRDAARAYLFSGIQLHLEPEPPTSQKIAEIYRPFFIIDLLAFGAERCMFESNYPADRQQVDYVVLWNGFKRLAAGAGTAEKEALFSATARRIYSLTGV